MVDGSDRAVEPLDDNCYPNASETKRRLLQACNESVMERCGLNCISNAAAQNWEARPISRAVSKRSDL
jgi:hypothetical protein